MLGQLLNNVAHNRKHRNIKKKPHIGHNPSMYKIQDYVIFYNSKKRKIEVRYYISPYYARIAAKLLWAHHYLEGAI